MNNELEVTFSDPNFEVRSTLRTIKENSELLQTLSGPERRTLREQNRKLRSKVTQLRGLMLEHYDSDWLFCRDVAHRWVTSYAEVEIDGTAVRLLTCEQCGTERQESYNSDGFLLTRRYTHPDGYLMQGELAGALRNGSKEFWRGIEYLGLQQRNQLESGLD
jgi:hypothetical protein